jgi:NAD(P)-dependent dehydrogenase (short-subunit alcohol dehydrogenase family)
MGLGSGWKRSAEGWTPALMLSWPGRLLGRDRARRVVDLTDPLSRERLESAVEASLGGLDVVISSTGFAPAAPDGRVGWPRSGPGSVPDAGDVAQTLLAIAVALPETPPSG